MPDKIVNDGHASAFSNQVDRSIHFQSSRQHNKYQLIKITSLDIGTLQASGKPYSCYGDTITVDRVDASHACYIKIEDSSNPWIRIREGDIFTRPNAFTKIILCFADASIQGGGGVGAFFHNSVVYLYVSHGPLRQRVKNHRGFGKDAIALRNCVADIAPSWLFKDYFPFPTNSGNAALLTAGMIGAQLILKNTDAANTLILRLTNSGVGGPGFPGFPLGPGETITLDLDRSICDMIDGIDGLPLPHVYTDAGTCQFAWMLSTAELDASQIGQTTFPLDMS